MWGSVALSYGIAYYRLKTQLPAYKHALLKACGAWYQPERRGASFSKDLTWFEKQLWVSLAYYHLVLPHKRLQEPLPTPEPTRGAGSPRKWRPVTTAMAAGLTDHVWSTNELLSYHVPAVCLDQLREAEYLFPSWDEFHHGR